MTVGGLPLEDVLRGLGVVSLLAVAVLAFFRRWVVTGEDHRERIAELTKERDEWRRAALRSMTVTERTTTASEVAAGALAALPEALGGDGK